MLTNRTGAMKDLLKTKAPDDLIVDFARHRAANLDSRIECPHFFAFGGVAKAARWANAVRDGRIRFNKKESGFEVV